MSLEWVTPDGACFMNSENHELSMESAYRKLDGLMGGMVGGHTFANLGKAASLLLLECSDAAQDAPSLDREALAAMYMVAVCQVTANIIHGVIHNDEDDDDEDSR